MSSQNLNDILKNKTFGSSEIVKLLNDYFYSFRNNIPEVHKNIKKVKLSLTQFQAVNTYLRELDQTLKKNNKTKLKSFLSGHSNKELKKFGILFNKVYPFLKDFESVITISRSGTVLEILKLWYKKNKSIEVVVCESRPMFEGRLLAIDLVKKGIKVKLITDAMMGLYVNEVDAAIIGADAVLKNGNIINKVGSKALALLCRDQKKPLYVVSSKSKFSNQKYYKPKSKNPNEVWDKKFKNFSVQNIYFEEIEKKLITKVVTD